MQDLYFQINSWKFFLEIIDQLKGKVDLLVATAGTGGMKKLKFKSSTALKVKNI